MRPATTAGAPEMPLAPKTPLWLAARSLLTERGDDFFALLRRAGDNPRPEMIHDLRVASRRLREALALFAPCYRETALAPLRRQLRRITRDLGELRNADEALLLLRRLDNRLEPAGRAFLAIPLERCQQRRRQERQRLQPRWQKWQEGQLARRFSRAVRRPLLFAREPEHPAFLPIADFARDALDPQRTAIAQLLTAALHEEEAAAQHRLRIAVKHLRYRGEILSFLFAPGFADLHGVLKTLPGTTRPNARPRRLRRAARRRRGSGGGAPGGAGGPRRRTARTFSALHRPAQPRPPCRRLPRRSAICSDNRPKTGQKAVEFFDPLLATCFGECLLDEIILKVTGKLGWTSRMK